MCGMLSIQTQKMCRKEKVTMTNSKLREIRISNNMTMDEMSKFIGVSRSLYEKIEYMQRTPSYNFIKKFKNKFPSCNTDDIFF